MVAVTLIPGDGIGPEIIAATRSVVDAACPDIEWEQVEAGEKAFARHGSAVPVAVTESISSNKVVLKGPLTNPFTGYTSPNLEIYKRVGVWYRVRAARSFPGIPTPFPGTNITLIRETTEGWIKGAGHYLNDDVGIAISYTTRSVVRRVARVAYSYAVRQGLRRVTIPHQARVLRSTDGRYVQTALDAARDFPELEVTEELLDAACQRLVTQPQEYQLLLCPNPYGGVLEGICAGLTGSAGLMASVNYGQDIAIFEASHGTAPKHAGHNHCNPTALIEAAAMMLDHIDRPRAAGHIRAAVREVIQEGHLVTYDLGGSASTTEMAAAIIAKIEPA